jgi:hypothetical protein
VWRCRTCCASEAVAHAKTSASPRGRKRRQPGRTPAFSVALVCLFRPTMAV